MSSQYSSDIKIRALKLRKQGKSFRDISKELNLPLGTAHLWTRHIRLSKTQEEYLIKRREKRLKTGQKRKLNEKRIIRNQNILDWIGFGRDRIGILTDRERLLTAAALYWSEGFKKDLRLGLANSDPEMINFFIRWLIDDMGVPKKDIRLRLGVNEMFRKSFRRIETKWSDITGIPLRQFQKPFFQKTKWQKKYSNPGNYLGVLRIRANNQIDLFWRIKGMVEGLRKE